MFVDNGNQLKNYGIQLQNMGMEIHNFGLQMKNNIMMNIGNQMLIQKIGDQIQNMGTQISNIAIQIFNMGIQMSNIIMNQNNINMMNLNDLMNNNMIMNEINEEIMDDNKGDSYIFNIVFISQTGYKNNIAINSKRTVEDLFNLFLKEKGLSSYDIQKKKIFFLFNGIKLNIKDKRKIEEVFNNGHKIQVMNF